jgi:hypothetical protein
MVTLDQESLIQVTAAVVAIGITVFFTPCVSIFAKLLSLLSLKRKAQQKASATPDGSVSGVFIHPVKSLRAVSLDQAMLDEKGFFGDRRFMLVYPSPKFPGDTTHRFLTQRQCPSLATVVAKLDEDSIILECNGKSVEISTDIQDKPARKTFEAGIWDDKVQVEDMGEEAAAFLKEIVNADENCQTGDEGDECKSGEIGYNNVRLAYHSACDRLSNAKYTPASAKTWLGKSPLVSLTDGFPILIACEASLQELNKKLNYDGKQSISMSRFRPNIVVKGTKPFEEDKWKYVSIGGELFAIVKACPRCKQSCTDQETGAVSSEPVTIMKSFRALGNNQDDVFFAQNAIPLGRGNIKVGDEVRVLERGDPIYS